MRDHEIVLQACRKAKESNTPFALATVVMVEGSAYRRPGAKMLIVPEGKRLGSISGGCLESDVAAHAKEVCASGKPKFVLYDAKSSAGDLLFDMGCNGAVGILIERIAEPAVGASLGFLERCLRQRRTGVLATVFRVAGDCPVQVGQHFALSAMEPAVTDVTFAPLRDALQADAQSVLISHQTQTLKYRFPNGTAEVLLEAVVPPISLLICGAGYDAVPLAEGAARLGWQVTVADHRGAMLEAAQFPPGTIQLETCPQKLLHAFVPDSRTAAILMTHNAERDREYLRCLLPSAVGYLGLLGPRRRGIRLLTEMEADGMRLCAESLARLYSPAGLDIGSETPQEIALAILAEIQTVMADRTGASLRARPGAIHAAEVRRSVPSALAEKAGAAWYDAPAL